MLTAEVNLTIHNNVLNSMQIGLLLKQASHKETRTERNENITIKFEYEYYTQ